MTTVERKVWDQAFEQGRTFGMVALFVLPLVTIYGFPWFWAGSGLAVSAAGVVLVFGQLLLIMWLPEKIGVWMAQRALANFKHKPQ